MPGEHSTLKRFSYSSVILQAIGYISFFLGIESGVLSGSIIVDQNVQVQFYLILIFAAIPTVALIVSPREDIRIASATLLLLFYALLSFFSLPYLRLTILFIVPLVIIMREFHNQFGLKGKGALFLFSFSASVVAMILLSGLIRYDPVPQNIGLLVASISDDVATGGTPLIFSGGLVFFSRYFVMSISIQSLALYSALSALLVQNYFLIVRFVRKNSGGILGGQISGALTVLSCQCESITAVFPSIVSLILSAVIVPLIAESLALVLLTNYMLRTRYSVGNRIRILDSALPGNDSSRRMFISTGIIIIVPLVEVAGVYLSLQRNLYFYGALNFMMFVVGILIITIVQRFARIQYAFTSRSVPVFLLAVSSILMLLGFYPPLVGLALANGVWFSILDVAALAGGAVAGLVYIFLRRYSRTVFLEFLAMMFTMFAVVVFYGSALLGYTFWAVFGLTQQVIFSLALWIVTLPLMWLATNIALNDSVKVPGGPIPAK